MADDFSTPAGIDPSLPMAEQMARAQAILDAGTANAVPDDIEAPAAEEAPGPADTMADIDGISDEELGITEEAKTAFFESILGGIPYCEELPLFDGKLKIGFRARTAGESEKCLVEAGNQGAETVIDYELHLTLRYLAYSLEYIEGEGKGRANYDHGTLQERIDRLRQLPAPLYTALMDLNSKFDRKIHRMSILSVQPSFWQPATAS